MPVNRRPKKSSYYYYTLTSERESGVQQWHFQRKKLLSVAGIAVVFISLILFLSADALSTILYKAKIQDINKNYSHLTKTLTQLQTQLQDVTGQISEIEEKDKAIRTYANLPKIDSGIQKLGIGGMRVGANSELDRLKPDVKTRISELEMDMGELSRRVKMELASYNTMVDKVKDYSDQLQSIPSIRPVQEGYLGSGYGYRKDPFNEKVRFHYGQDFAVNTGTRIYSPADGIVKYASRQGGYGKVIKLDHGNGYRTLYAHLSKIKVKRGEEIKRGDLIGISGNTGRSAGPHLHYEVHRYGAPQNPLDYFFSGYLK